MRIWDVAAGYLNRQSLLAEHRELHGVHSILANGKTGYARHPETRRWVGCLPALVRRHELLAAEMSLRGFAERTPLLSSSARPTWPRAWVTTPAGQYDLLGAKYVGKEPGRIPLPRSAQELWAHHKYSVMARDPELYRSIGRWVARRRRSADLTELSLDLVTVLREAPRRGRVINAVEHMWGHVSRCATPDDRAGVERGPAAMLATTQDLARRIREPYVLTSTALSELMVFVGTA